MKKKLSELEIKYAALLIVEPDGSAYIYKPHWDKAVRVQISAKTPRRPR